MKKVLTIIVTYNFEPWLDKCVQSLLDSSYPNDILIVDNNSKDNTVELLKQRYPAVQVISNPTNLGFGCANNRGFKIALEGQYDFAFLVNQDAWVAKDCLEKLVSCYTANFGIISPVHLDGTGKQLDSGFRAYTQNAQERNGYRIVPFINAAFWLLPIQVLKSVGGFSPIFYHYGEDKDYANRVNFHQLKTIFVNDALAYHDRQDRVVSLEAHYKSEFVYHLTEYCNINYSWINAFANACGASLKKGILALRKKDKKSLNAYLGITWRIFCLTPNVLKTRSLNKKSKQEIN